MTATKTSPKKPRKTKRAARGEAIARGMGKDARAGENAAQRRVPRARHPFTAMLEKVYLLAAELADYAQRSKDEKILGAARVVEALHACLAEPVMFHAQDRPVDVAAKLKKAASDLRGITKRLRDQRNGGPTQESRLPSRLEELDTAARALAEDVARAMANRDPNEDPAIWSATALEISRAMNADRGAAVVLPHAGTSAERIALFTEVIRTKVQPFTDPGQEMDSKAILVECHKACGGNGQPFRAEQKRLVRQRKREREKRKATTG